MVWLCFCFGFPLVLLWLSSGFHGFLGSFMVFHGFWLVSMAFQGSFMVFHGFWLVSMVFQGIFMVFHGFWLVSVVFKVFSWFFMVFGWFPWFFKVFSCKWHLISQGNPDQGYCFPKIDILSKVSTPKVHKKNEKVSEK